MYANIDEVMPYSQPWIILCAATRLEGIHSCMCMKYAERLGLNHAHLLLSSIASHPLTICWNNCSFFPLPNLVNKDIANSKEFPWVLVAANAINSILAGERTISEKGKNIINIPDKDWFFDRDLVTSQYPSINDARERYRKLENHHILLAPWRGWTAWINIRAG